jgi:hypothetical protein
MRTAEASPTVAFHTTIRAAPGSILATPHDSSTSATQSEAIINMS